tara:strand:- start:2804 stop:3247 length:444 start_codon:yes stop_codon:yes gene_type:complete
MNTALILTLSGLLAAPAPPSGLRPELQQRLEVEAHWLEQGAPAPRAGFLVRRVELARLLGELQTQGRACEGRVRDQQQLCMRELAANTARCEERLTPLTARIDELQGIEDQLTERLSQQRRELWWWKVGTAAGGSVLLTALTLSLAR